MRSSGESHFGFPDDLARTTMNRGDGHRDERRTGRRIASLGKAYSVFRKAISACLSSSDSFSPNS